MSLSPASQPRAPPSQQQQSQGATLYPPDEVFSSADDEFMAAAAEEQDSQDLLAHGDASQTSESMDVVGAEPYRQQRAGPSHSRPQQQQLQQQQQQAVVRVQKHQGPRQAASPYNFPPPPSAGVESLPRDDVASTERYLMRRAPKVINLNLNGEEENRALSTDGDILISEINAGNYKISLVNRRIFGSRVTVVRFAKKYLKNQEDKSFSMDVPAKDFEGLQKAFLLVRKEPEYQKEIRRPRH